MTDYAMLRYETNTVRKVVEVIKPHPNALPVEYPTPGETELTHIISLNPIELWEVDNEYNKVIATYSIIPKNFNNEKEKILETIRNIRKDKINNTILTINYETDLIFTTKTDRSTRNDIRDVVLQFRDNLRDKVYWEYDAHKWVYLDGELSELIWKTITDYRDSMFTRQFELEDEINNLDDTGFQELYDINDKSYNYYDGELKNDNYT